MIDSISIQDYSRFNNAVQIVLQHEGRLTQDKSDPGGITNWGISLQYLKEIKLDIDRDGDIDDDDIKELTLSEAKFIYEMYWWNRFNYNNLNDLTIATKVFDLSVNMGSKQCHKILQQSIDDISKDKIAIDGILGPKTFDAANHVNPKKLLDRLRYRSQLFYTNLVEKKPKLRKFITGWLNRARW